MSQLLNRLLISCQAPVLTSSRLLATWPSLLATNKRSFSSDDKSINKPFRSGTISRRNYAADVEDAVNHQINKELQSSYKYGAMVSLTMQSINGNI